MKLCANFSRVFSLLIDYTAKNGLNVLMQVRFDVANFSDALILSRSSVDFPGFYFHSL